METTVRHEADLDALAYFEYLNVRSAEAAVRFLRAVDETVEELAQQPGMGRLRRFRGRDLRNIRSWRVNGFENHLIFYRWEGECLDILRIRHGARKSAPAQNFTKTDDLQAWQQNWPARKVVVKVVYDRSAGEVRVTGISKGRRIQKTFPVEKDVAATLRLADVFIRTSL